MSDPIGGYLNQAASAYRNATAYARPICRLVVNGQDITAAVTQRLVGIELTDNRGMEADQLTVTLSDHDGLLAIPPRGAEVRLWLGWSDTGLVDKGRYTVDEVEHSGAPDVLSIRARSADLRSGLKGRRERSWHGQTLGAVVQAIAAAYGLTPVIGAGLANIPLAHLDQANESDANLLSRLGQQHDAIATVKAGRLLFMPVGQSTTASGLPLPHVTLTRQDGDQHRYLEADRDSYTGVRAYYYEINSAEKKQAIAGGDDSNLKDLRHVYSDRQSALVAAGAEWRRLQRGTATLSYTLAKGRPDLIPELTYSLVGIKPEIAAYVWLGGNIRHSFTAEAYTTSLELDSKLPDAEEVAELAEEGHYTGIVAWYRDSKNGEQKQITKGYMTRPKRLTHLYESKASAEKVAEREWKRLQAAQA